MQLLKRLLLSGSLQIKDLELAMFSIEREVQKIYVRFNYCVKQVFSGLPMINDQI